jgi:predicted dehydrogenase
MEDVEIVAVCDPDLVKAKAIAEKYNIANVYGDYREALANLKPDFVDVITRPDTHLEICSSVAASQTPMICQKPLAPTVAEAVEIVRVAEQYSAPMMVHENFRFQPWYREMRQIWESGVVGDRVHTVSFKNRAGDGWGDDAYLARQPYFQTMPKFLIFEAGIHTIDSFRFLAGEISRVWCKLRKLNPVIAGEDAGIAVFEFESGALGHYDANRYNESTASNPRYTFGEISLEADGGTIRVYDDGRLTVQKLGKPESAHEYLRPANGFAGDCVFATQKHFVDQLRSEACFETSGQDYLKNIALQEAMYRSSESGGWEIPDNLLESV